MEITTARLRIREYVAADGPEFLAYQSEARAREFYDLTHAQLSKPAALVPLFMQWAAEVPRRNWQLAVARRETPETLIGSVGLRTAGATTGVAEFGLDLAPSVWGNGYAFEAARAFMAFGFTALSLATIRGTTVSANTSAMRLVERLGFRQVAEVTGSAWLVSRGWCEVTWELRREDWLGPG